MPVKEHLVIAAIPGWGHIRPLIVLACRILELKPEIGITILTVGLITKKTEEELARYLPTELDGLRNNVRIISFLERNTGLWEDFKHAPRACLKFLESIYRQDSVKCLVSGRTFKPWPKPNIVISDICFDIVKGVRSIDPEVTILGWSPVNNSCCLRSTGPEELGGLGDISAKALVLAERTGKSANEIEKNLCHAKDGNLIQVPGMPLMYDYEFYPQSVIGNFMTEADGIITPGTSAVEAEALTALKKWQTSLGKELYIVGPLLDDVARKNEMAISDKGFEIKEFLEKTLLEHGKHSLIYISFGSIWWPDVNHICGVLDVLIEQKVPFIFAYGSEAVPVPDRSTEKVQEAAIGLLSTWSTGWFLSHCGQNSVTESLAEGVPIIAWPIVADQPDNAALISITLNVGYQLTEARTGDAGLRPMKRGVKPTGTVDAIQREIREILQRARGEDGKIKRTNAEVISNKMKEDWEENGEAGTGLKRLLEKELTSYH
ncbi:glycosyltransferase family 1 protein [Sphaerobolus stellatus SS14]|uniref:Glycosyltransferase family 1 protein n=1 Tax=Sphaerobolus stellatus (strain SS14) TaxID=990650 RepID=A0A0C9W4L3_SPHS4|nr:glycosyltransferase family 1 protein [Sphaerobolus stellatus SS14]